MLISSTRRPYHVWFLGLKVILLSDTIAKATRCLREGNTYLEGWERNYNSHITRALYRYNADKASDKKTIVYNFMCGKEKIWDNILNNSVLHKAGSKTIDLHKFMRFHLTGNLLFDLPHIIYINILRNIKGLGGLNRHLLCSPHQQAFMGSRSLLCVQQDG